jgi:hypothetical protein
MLELLYKKAHCWAFEEDDLIKYQPRLACTRESQGQREEKEEAVPCALWNGFSKMRVKGVLTSDIIAASTQSDRANLESARRATEWIHSR